MRNAALVLGIIAGVIGMIVGLFGYGWTSLVERQPDVETIFGNFDNPALVRFVSVVAPVLAIAGGAMAKVRALWGGILLIVSAVLMQQAFTFNTATMFPIVMAGLAGILAIAAGRPDEPKSHF
jgi:hypothetical protein